MAEFRVKAISAAGFCVYFILSFSCLPKVKCDSMFISLAVIGNMRWVHLPLNTRSTIPRGHDFGRIPDLHAASQRNILYLRGGGGCLSCFPRKPPKPNDPFTQITLVAFFNASTLNISHLAPGVLGSHESLGSWMQNQVIWAYRAAVAYTHWFFILK